MATKKGKPVKKLKFGSPEWRAKYAKKSKKKSAKKATKKAGK